jgi:hypothetical protein
VANYTAVQGVMSAIQDMLQERLPAELSGSSSAAAGSGTGGVAVNASVQLFGSADFNQTNPGNMLALYLYRISIDPTVVGGYVRALPGTAGGRTSEVALMLHFLMIAIANSAIAEISLMGWGFQQLAVTSLIGADRLAAQGLVGLAPGAPGIAWDDSDSVQVATEELTREELMRIWDTLPGKYRLTVPYVVRGLRLTLGPDMRQYAPVLDRSLVMGVNA